jgi:hypothetical protein
MVELLYGLEVFGVGLITLIYEEFFSSVEFVI